MGTLQGTECELLLFLFLAEALASVSVSPAGGGPCVAGHSHLEGPWFAEESLVSLTGSLMTTRLHGICSDLVVDASRDPERISPVPPSSWNVTREHTCM